MEYLAIYQIVFAALTLIAAVNVVLARNPVVSAMSLMAALFSTGVLYFGLEAYFIGVVQILIYAGAISVLFVFIVMLLDLKPHLVRIPGQGPKTAILTVGGALLMAAILLPLLRFGAGTEAASPADVALAAQDAHAISQRFLSKYMLPFQATGLLIFAAVIGVILVARPKHQVHEPKGGRA